MRRLLLACLVLSASAAAAAAQASVRMDDGEPRVVASATRSARLIPDRVSFYVIIEGPGETSVDAAERASKKVLAVTDAIKLQGGKAELVSSIPFGVAPAPNYGGYPGQPLQNPFVGRHAMRLQLARVDQLSSVAAALMAAGATGITAPQFEASAVDSVRRSKVSEAIAAARADAEMLAAGVGMRLGTLIEVAATPSPISAPFTQQQYIPFGRGMEMSQVSTLPDVTVTAGVTLRYRLVPR